MSETPCLSLAIDRLTVAAGAFAIRVLHAPYPGGFAFQDALWTEAIAQEWQEWQEMFSSRSLPTVPLISSVSAPPVSNPVPLPETPTLPLGGRRMQRLGISLWQWLFSGTIQASLNRSQGIAIGQNKPLRLRLEIGDPNLIELPWEIMQPDAGMQAISLNQQQLLFSRTTSDVDPLPPQQTDQVLKILLVLGQDAEPNQATDANSTPQPEHLNQERLKLEQEATALAKVLEDSGRSGLGNSMLAPAPCQVHSLVQPTPAELIRALERGSYNVLFYAGHGAPAPDGGLLFLRPDTTLNGTELAQVLTRCRVKLAVFNACWGAQPDQHNQKTIPRSSLAEVLIHHGVPAVLGMRDSITDQEALSFIQTFARALADRMPIDRAVAVARQQLLTLYKFNQPAWTLPVLYMHPQFDGELIKPIKEGSVTELPSGYQPCPASLLYLGNPPKVWAIRGGMMRIGSDPQDNDLVIPHIERGVSRRHAMIFCRTPMGSDELDQNYCLRDESRFGTWMLTLTGWQKVHHQEVPLQSGTQLKFGSTNGEVFEFRLEA